MAILFSTVAVIAGLAVAFVLVVGLEVVGNVVHPFPEGVDPSDMEACRAHVARIPAWFLAAAVPAWGFTTFAGAWVATRLGTGRHRAHGYLVGAILFAAACFNMSLLPYPLWFPAANLIVLPLGFVWGSRLGGPRRPTADAPAPDSRGA